MLKKLISTILVVVICFGVFTPLGVLGNTADKFSERFVSGLGIVDLSVDEPDMIVTRELFALYVARMLKIDTNSTNDVRYFVDMENNAFSATAVNSLVEIGIISLPENRLFRPAENITYNEALKMLLCAAGYGEYADANGGYPMGYHSVARMLNINFTVIDSEKITVSQMCDLIFEIMFVPMYDVGSIIVINGEVNSDIYTANKDNTLIYLYWKILRKRGTVDAVYGATLDPQIAVKNQKQAVVDGVLYELDDNFDFTPFIGNYVEYYIEESDYRDKLIGAKFCRGQEDVVIDIEDFSTIRDDKLFYYTRENGKEKFLLLHDPDIIYNGGYLGTNVAATLSNLSKGTITVKDQNGDSTYDTVIIEDYKNFVIGSISTDLNVIYNKLNSSKPIVVDNVDALLIYDVLRNYVAIDSLKVGQVLSVAESADGKFVKAITSMGEVAGILENMVKTGEELEAKINGELYPVEKSYISKFEDSCCTGEKYTFLLDHLGNIAYVGSYDSDPMSYGYVIGLSYESFSNVLNVKLLTQKEGVKIFNVSDRTILDGSRGQNRKLSQIKDLLCDGTSRKAKNQLIRYQLNAEGEIIEIDTKDVLNEETEENSMFDIFKGNEKQERWYAASAKNLDRVCLIQDSTPVFYVPNNGGFDEDYYVGTHKEKFWGDRKLLCDAYSNNSLQAFADAVVVYYTISDTNQAVANTYFTVDEITRQLIGDRDVAVVSGYKGNSYANVEVADNIDLSALEKGDIVKFSYDIYGNAVFYPGTEYGYVHVFDCSDKIPNWNAIDPENAEGRLLYEKGDSFGQGYRHNRQLSFGNVMFVEDGVVKFDGTGYSKYTDAANLTNFIKIIYDEAQDKLYVGDMVDIVDYRSAGENCSKIVLFSTSGNTLCAVIYNFESSI